MHPAADLSSSRTRSWVARKGALEARKLFPYTGHKRSSMFRGASCERRLVSAVTVNSSLKSVRLIYPDKEDRPFARAHDQRGSLNPTISSIYHTSTTCTAREASLILLRRRVSLAEIRIVKLYSLPETSCAAKLINALL